MDSVSTRRRRQRSQKLFLQNCIQDWIFAIDSVNSTWLDNLWKNVVYSFFFNIYSNLSVHVIDGLVMLFFNYEKKPKKLQALAAKKSETSHFTGNTTGSIVRI